MTEAAQSPMPSERNLMRLRSRGLPIGTLVRIAALALLVVLALTTPGFLSRVSLIALANAMSLVGCVALAMAYLTIGGNVMSLSLAATASVAGMVFMAGLGWGLLAATLMALLAGGVISGLQGVVIGWLRANPIIVSLAAYALLAGAAQLIVGPKVLPAGPDFQLLRGRWLEIPISFFIFAGLAVVGQVILSFTHFGHQLMFVGSNSRAAEAAGIHVGRVTVAAHVLAGVFAAIGGILVASRFGSADMQTARGFEYTAIAAVLIGGTSIVGGSGSLLQTFLGMATIVVINALVLMQGFSMEVQRLTVGCAVLVVIVLQGLGRMRR
ncbi:MAG: ABC transporter permease [Devosia sp.]|nr:ABC transporter permease [Devosia sp.]